MLAGHSNSLGDDSMVLAPPYKFDGARLPVRRMPPALGQDTQTVLQSLLNLGPEDMALLAEEGVI